MSTRSRVAVALPEGGYHSIYVHWDGYPDGVGQTLLENYHADNVHALMGLGDLSQLGPEVGEKHPFFEPRRGWCKSYRRDRGDTGTGARLTDWDGLARLSESSDAEWLYLLLDGRWLYAPVGDRPRTPEDLAALMARKKTIQGA